LGFGEVAGASAAEGAAAVLAGESVSVPVGVGCFDGEDDSMGVSVSNCDWTCATQMVRPTSKTNRSSLVAIKDLGKSSSYRKRISDNALIFIISHLSFGLTRSGHDGKTAAKVSDLEIQSRD
jgi:hypothetical protein